MPKTLDTDYLIIGAGAMGMAFADELITQSKDARIILVDRRAQPGGHWVNAYPFVTLHQPAIYYGVNSEKLATDLHDLASGSRIVAYYQKVMDKLCATGRVRFLSECDSTGQGHVQSLTDPEVSYQITVHQKTVDATYSRVEVPSTHPPQYKVADEVSLVPINGLADLKQTWSRFVIIGAGKTGMDALLYLLEQGVAPERLTWIISNDVWFIPRENAYPEVQATQMRAQLPFLVKCRDTATLYAHFEALGWITRLNPEIEPTRFRCATVSKPEIAALKALPNKVRLGRVQRIEPTEIVLDSGTIPTGPDVLHVDCTACGLVARPPRPIFAGETITLQPVMLCQPTFSAALIALVEARCADDAAKNRHCTPVPHPEYPHDLVVRTADSFANTLTWLRPFSWWLSNNRLSVTYHLSLIDKVRFMLLILRWLRRTTDNLKRIHNNEEEANSKESDSAHDTQ